MLSTCYMEHLFNLYKWNTSRVVPLKTCMLMPPPPLPFSFLYHDQVCTTINICRLTLYSSTFIYIRAQVSTTLVMYLIFCFCNITNFANMDAKWKFVLSEGKNEMVTTSVPQKLLLYSLFFNLNWVVRLSKVFQIPYLNHPNQILPT